MHIVRLQIIEHSSTYECLLLLGASVYDDFTNEIPNADSVHAPTDYNEILSLCFIVLEGDMMVVVILHVALLFVVALMRDACCLALTSLALSSPSLMALAVLEV